MKISNYNEYIFLIGKNSQDNWDILDICKKENEKFIWFHLNSFPSCYVILKNELKDLDKNQVNELILHGAKLCKENTKYKNLKDIKIQYTTLDKLKKTNKVGEVLVSGKKKYIKL